MKEIWEELKAALIIAYPNCEGLGEWEPAQMILKEQYEWENTHTDQIDVNVLVCSILILKIHQCGGQGKN